jgi:hypothetical protein
MTIKDKLEIGLKRDRSFPAEDNVYLPKGGTALPRE